jgi:hypothetical protein
VPTPLLPPSESRGIFQVTVYFSEPDPQTLAKYWGLFEEEPFAAKKFDNVERTKRPFSRSADALALAARMFELGVLFVRGRSATAMSLADGSKISRWFFLLGKTATGAKSWPAWIDWLSRLLEACDAVYAFGCTDAERYLKHHIEVVSAQGVSRAERFGLQPGDLLRLLPGVYWFNFYGARLAAHLGERVQAQPELAVRTLPGGQLLATLKEAPAAADLEARLELEARIARNIGAEYFFDKATALSRTDPEPRLAKILGL